MNANSELVHLLLRRAFKNGLIVTFILMVIWAIVLEFIPEGWWVLAINIVGILITAWILLSTAIPFLKVYLPTLIAVIASGILWFVMFVAIRFVIGAIIGTAVISPFSGLDNGTERQEVVDYLESMMPVIEAQADWKDDQNTLAEARNLNREELMDEFTDLLYRMDKIYMDVETSVPPPEMREFKRKWSRECQLTLQATNLMIQSLDTGKWDLMTQAMELIFDANVINEEYYIELMDILDRYNIDAEDFSKTLPITPAPAPAPAPEPAIPSHYTTYTNEANIFSISYPPDWEVNLSLIEDVNFQEYMKQSLQSGTPEIVVEAMSSMMLFLAGIPTGKGGYSPNVNVGVVPLFGEESNLDDLIDEKIRASKELYTEYTVLLRIRTTVDRTEAVITESETYLTARGRGRHLTMHMLKYNVIWVVTCTSSPTEFTNYEDDFYHVVRSLRILK